MKQIKKLDVLDIIPIQVGCHEIGFVIMLYKERIGSSPQMRPKKTFIKVL